jgi:WD40 repeat protein
MRNLIRVLATILLAAMPALAQPLPEGAIARVGSTRFREDSGVVYIAFSPDGKWIAHSDGNFVAVSDVSNGKSIFRTGSEPFSEFAFARDGKTLRIVDPEKIRDFSIDKGKLTRTQELERHRARESFCEMSPDGRFAIYPVTESIAALMDLESGKVMQTFAGAAEGEYWFSKNGNQLAIRIGGSIQVRDALSGKIAYFVQDLDRKTAIPLIGPDGRLWAIGDATASFSLVDGPTGKTVRRFCGTWRFSSTVTFSQDGKKFAVKDDAKQTIQLFDVESGKRIHELSCYAAGRFCFSPNGKTLAVARYLDGLVFFDLATGKRLPTSSDPPGHIFGIQFVDSGKKLLIDADDLSVRDWRTGEKVLHVSDAKQFGTQTVLLSPDTRFLAQTDGKTTVTIVNRLTGRVERNFPGHAIVGFTPDSQGLITRGSVLDFECWNVKNSKKLSLKVDGNNVRDLVALGQGDRWFQLYLNQEWWMELPRLATIRFWDLATGRVSKQCELLLPHCDCQAISTDGKILAVGKQESNRDPRFLEIWDVRSQKKRFVADTSIGASALSFAPDNAVLAIADRDWIRLLEVTSGHERRRFEQHAEHLAFSSDGRNLASASPIFIWDTWQATGKLEPAKTAWENLANSDAKAAFQTMCRMVAQPTDGVAILKSNLKPASKLDAQKVHDWVVDLSDKQFAVREKASSELANVADCYEFSLRQELEKATSAESRRRLQLLLDRQHPSGERLRQSRSVEVLERIGTPDALAVLRDLAAGAEGAAVTLDAQAALRRSR